MADTPPKPPPRPTGRPRVAERGSVLSAYLPVRQVDQIIALARTRDQSVSATVRHLLTKQLSPRGTGA
jgi:hypothetical protein